MILRPPVEVAPRCHLWIADFADEPSIVLPEPDELDHSEMQRWIRYRVAEKKRQFLLSRRAVSSVIRHTFPESGVCMQSTVSGKPRLISPDGTTAGSISLSHSGQLAAILLSPDRIWLGVDIETGRPAKLRPLQDLISGPEQWAFVARQGEFHECGRPAPVARHVREDRTDSGNPADSDADDAVSLLFQWTRHEALWKSLPTSLQSASGTGSRDSPESSRFAKNDTWHSHSRRILPFHMSDTLRIQLCATDEMRRCIGHAVIVFPPG